MDKKLPETQGATNLCVETMNSGRQAKGKLGHVVQIQRQTTSNERHLFPLLIRPIGMKYFLSILTERPQVFYLRIHVY